MFMEAITEVNLPRAVFFIFFRYLWKFDISKGLVGYFRSLQINILFLEKSLRLLANSNYEWCIYISMQEISLYKMAIQVREWQTVL
jgi:hypothetical protein